MKLEGSIASREVSLTHSEDFMKTRTTPTSYKKRKSAFDEYEGRGGVLEDYEDLDPRKSQEHDQVLSQMISA